MNYQKQTWTVRDHQSRESPSRVKRMQKRISENTLVCTINFLNVFVVICNNKDFFLLTLELCISAWLGFTLTVNDEKFVLFCHVSTPDDLHANNWCCCLDIHLKTYIFSSMMRNFCIKSLRSIICMRCLLIYVQGMDTLI